MTVTTGGGGAICEGCLPQPVSNEPIVNTAVRHTQSVLMKRRNSEPRRCSAGIPAFGFLGLFRLRGAPKRRSGATAACRQCSVSQKHGPGMSRKPAVRNVCAMGGFRRTSEVFIVRDFKFSILRLRVGP